MASKNQTLDIMTLSHNLNSRKVHCSLFGCQLILTIKTTKGPSINTKHYALTHHYHISLSLPLPENMEVNLNKIYTEILLESD
jgi:hypothetical protein